MVIPLTTFDGHLKRVDRTLLGDAAACVIDRAFPHFWPADPNSEEMVRRKNALLEAGVDYLYQARDPPRRLAGCRGLNKGRYATLCLDASGNDEGTLVNELNAYLDPLRAGLLTFFDLGIPQHLEGFKRFEPSAEPQNTIALLLVGRPGARSPVIQELDSRGITPGADRRQSEERCMIGVEIPYRVDTVRIPGVFDLRTPTCQAFLVEEFFKKDCEVLTKRNRDGVTRFLETLPLLMNPDRGGGVPEDRNGGLLQALAAFLRKRGVQALIFPSARSNVLAEIQDHVLRRWRGWCLVDYREAREPLVSESYDLSEGWPQRFPSGTQIRFADDAEFGGSFEVTGLVEWHHERIGEQEAAFLKAQA